jgi:predicted metal-dependent hydrolase
MGLFFKKNPNRKAKPVRIERTLLLKKYPVEIHRVPRRRQTALVVEPRGQILIKCALNTRQRDLEELVISHEEWLKAHLKRAAEYQRKYPLKKFIPGETYPLQGRLMSLKVKVSASTRWKLESVGTDLVAHVPRNFKEIYDGPSKLRNAGLKEIRAFYKKVGVSVLRDRMEYWAQVSGLRPKKLSFRSQKTLWGSCSSKGHISLNWRMVAFPEEVYDYILVHELCHLVHQNHSPQFWALVETFQPNFKQQRRWLRQNQNAVDFLAK